jgi:integrase
VRQPWRPPAGFRYKQLSLFDLQPSWNERHGIPDPPDQRLAARLDALACEHAVRHGWTNDTLGRTRLGLRVVLGLQRDPGGPFPISTLFEQLTPRHFPAAPVIAVLTEAGLVAEDRTPAVKLWFEARVAELPPKMAEELRAWFDVLHAGSSTAPRSLPRSVVTIKTRVMWALPTLRAWARNGTSSLREVSRDDVIAALPASGNPRATLGLALKSIFKVLKARKLVFTNPIAGISTGMAERRQPLPLDPDDVRRRLESDDPAQAVLAALIAFHGLRPAELRALHLTDVRDGRIFLPDRTVLLAEPARERLAAWLDHRSSRWPRTANAHLFVHLRTATGTGPIGNTWIWRRLGTAPTKLRDDRLLDEAIATDGDVRRIADFFGVTVKTAMRYATVAASPDVPE